MADEKAIQKGKENKPADKKGNVSFMAKVGKFFKNLPANIARPFKNMWHELRKVTWPGKTELLNSTLVVVAFMVIMGVVIGLLDLGASSLVSVLVK